MHNCHCLLVPTHATSHLSFINQTLRNVFLTMVRSVALARAAPLRSLCDLPFLFWGGRSDGTFFLRWLGRGWHVGGLRSCQISLYLSFALLLGGVGARSRSALFLSFYRGLFLAPIGPPGSFWPLLCSCYCSCLLSRLLLFLMASSTPIYTVGQMGDIDNFTRFNFTTVNFTSVNSLTVNIWWSIADGHLSLNLFWMCCTCPLCPLLPGFLWLSVCLSPTWPSVCCCMYVCLSPVLLPAFLSWAYVWPHSIRLPLCCHNLSVIAHLSVLVSLCYFLGVYNDINWPIAAFNWCMCIPRLIR